MSGQGVDVRTGWSFELRHFYPVNILVALGTRAFLCLPTLGSLAMHLFKRLG